MTLQDTWHRVGWNVEACIAPAMAVPNGKSTKRKQSGICEYECETVQRPSVVNMSQRIWDCTSIVRVRVEVFCSLAIQAPACLRGNEYGAYDQEQCARNSASA